MLLGVLPPDSSLDAVVVWSIERRKPKERNLRGCSEAKLVPAISSVALRRVLIEISNGAA